MKWPNMAVATLKVLGDPCTFFLNDVLILETYGIYRTEQQLKQSQNKSERLLNCDVVTVPNSNLITSACVFKIGEFSHRVAGKPVRDASGGMIVMLESLDVEQTDTSAFDR